MNDYQAVNHRMHDILQIPDTFDVLTRELTLGDHLATFYFLNGFIKDSIAEKMFEFLLSIDKKQWRHITNMQDFKRACVSHTEAEDVYDINQAVTAVLSGMMVGVIEELDGFLVLDIRTYPSRSLEEPEDDRVLRGSHEGFKEILVDNIVLIRRRIRDPKLVVHYMTVGSKSKTDLVIMYLPNGKNEEHFAAMKQKIAAITIPSLTLSQQSLAECLLRDSRYHPMPRIRYTERPDAAAACLLEGKVLVIVDNSPSVMIFPTSLFDYQQETNDYYFPPLIGSYLRILRIVIMVLTIVLVPLWYLLVKNIDTMPQWLSFIQIQEPNSVHIFVQLLILEFIIDMIKLASLNTPKSLASSFSMLGALILGDFAVQAHIFVPEVLLCMAFVAIAGFTQPSYELGYAIKFFRLILLCAIFFLDWIGLVIGLILILVIIASTPTILPQNYLYPLIPFDSKRMKELFLRVPIHRNNS